MSWPEAIVWSVAIIVGAPIGLVLLVLLAMAGIVAGIWCFESIGSLRKR